MKLKKTVTPKQKAANQLNSRNSSGPRSDRGKRTSSMNALRFGLYSKRPVIRELDGEDASEQYEELRSDLYKEYNPVGPSATWYVDRMAQTRWRLGRVLRAERGACLLTPWDRPAWSEDGGPMHTVLTSLESVGRSVQRLDAATAEIERTGTLSEKDYSSVSELIGAELQNGDNSNEGRVCQAGTVTIDEDFRRRLNAKRSSLRSHQVNLDKKLSEGLANHISRWAVPSAGDLDRILRYELCLLKQFDWARRMLLDCQRQRNKR